MSRVGLKFCSLLAAAALCGTAAIAQQRIALKGGESAELGPVYWVAQCRSIMVGMPEVEILEGPPEVTLAVKEAMVLPRRQNCASKVPGGLLIATVKTVDEPKEVKLTYRLKYHTKDGERLRGNVYQLSLYP